MGDIILPGTDCDYRLRLNLDLVTALEEAGGSLLQVADRLAQQEIKVAEILPLLRIAYKKAGCPLDGPELDALVLCASPHMLMVELLTGILLPLKATGAVRVGEC